MPFNSNTAKQTKDNVTIITSNYAQANPFKVSPKCSYRGIQLRKDLSKWKLPFLRNKHKTMTDFIRGICSESNPQNLSTTTTTTASTAHLSRVASIVAYSTVSISSCKTFVEQLVVSHHHTCLPRS